MNLFRINNTNYEETSIFDFLPEESHGSNYFNINLVQPSNQEPKFIVVDGKPKSIGHLSKSDLEIYSAQQVEKEVAERMSKDILNEMSNEIAKSRYNSKGIIKPQAANPITDIEDINNIKQYFLNKNKQNHFRNYAIFVFAINSGLRCGDIIRLNYEDLFDEQGRVRKSIYIFEEKTSKKRKHGTKGKTVKITDAIRDALEEYYANMPSYFKKPGNPLFRSQKLNEDGEYRLRRPSFYQILRDTFADLGLEDIKGGTHIMRKTFGNMFYKKYGQEKLALLQQHFKHATPFQTLTYIGITQQEIDDCVSGLSL